MWMVATQVPLAIHCWWVEWDTTTKMEKCKNLLLSILYYLSSPPSSVLSLSLSLWRRFLQQDGLCFSWKNAIDPNREATVNQLLLQGSAALQATYIKDPMANPLFSVVPGIAGCVHPLGGCIMADDASQGVVNNKGQVYSSSSGSQVYSSLYVVDGAIVPASVGVRTFYFPL